ncbi:MAG: peptidase M23 [Flavobacteriales bacterium]|nr:peptidase M23 [Flavobacteriales bacterium]|tara:strand:- start:2829 stop:4085 length:1257 start_codon:yes stop_codon:yes gene_type:complete
MQNSKALLFFISLLVSFFFIGCNNPKPSESLIDNPDQLDTIIKEPQILYGFNVDSFKIVGDKVKKNQFFSDLITNHGISYSMMNKMATEGKEMFDVRRLRAGRHYTVFEKKDSTEKAQIFVYEIDRVNFIVYDLRDSLKIYRDKKPVKIVTKEASGVINSSLYLSLEKQGYNPELAITLSEVYAWSIDFYHIQKGDRFKVIYDEIVVDGESIGIKRIKAGYFEHFKKPFYAIQFSQNGQLEYYDQENRGLRRQFLKAPVKFSRISSRFSMRRYHPVQKRNKPHLGTDYAAPKGTPIYATANGVITHAKYNRYNGNYVKVRHNSVYTTQYLHMSKIKRGIRPGVKVNQGDVIGFVGSTGLATGPHVCYRFWKNGRQVDPYRQKLPKSKPIHEANLETYTKIKERVIAELDKISYPKEKQ